MKTALWVKIGVFCLVDVLRTELAWMSVGWREQPLGMVAVSGAHWEKTVFSLEYCGKSEKTICCPHPLPQGQKALQAPARIALFQNQVHTERDPLRHQVLNAS